ncbi:MAG: hypothetical protein R3B68_14440 [Phycisphaerales bacterium]
MLAMYAVEGHGWLAPLPVTAGVGVAIAVLLRMSRPARLRTPGREGTSGQ